MRRFLALVYLEALAIALIWIFTPGPHAVRAAGPIVAASCSFSDVSAAVAAAITNDTVVIPSSDCPSASHIIWGTNSVSDTGLVISLNITLECDVSEACYITDNMYKGGSSCSGGVPLISLVPASGGGNPRVTGLVIQGETTSANCGESEEHISVSGSLALFRIDHMRINGVAPAGNCNTSAACDVPAINTSNAAGVVDHDYFYDAGNTFPVAVHNGGSTAEGDTDWATADSMGMPGTIANPGSNVGNVIYIETNNFDWSGSSNFPVGCFDMEFGGRVVFRFNTGCPFVAMHGLDSSGRARSGRHYEIYGNSFTSVPVSANVPNMYTGIFLRGGTGMIVNNTFTDTGLASYVTLAQVNSYRATGGYAPWGPSYTAEGCDGRGPFDTNGSMDASGTASSGSLDSLSASGSPGWTSNQWVGYALVNTTENWGSTITANGSATITTQAAQQPAAGNAHNWANGDSFQIYKPSACLDQIGRGEGLQITGTNPVLQSTGMVGPDNEASDPLYDAANSYDGAPQAAVISNNGSLVANRDYYVWSSSFTGTSGAGSGTLASRPSTCTTGVGYWATDQGSWNQSGSGGQGELFVCTATNTWSLYWEPYSYPYPLTVVNPGCTGVAAPQTVTDVSSTFAELPGVDVKQVTSSGRNWNSYQAVPNFSTVTGQFVSNNQPAANNILIQNEDGSNGQLINGATQGVWAVMDQTGNFAVYQGENSDHTLDLYQTKISASGTCTQTNLTNLHLTFVSPTNAILYSNSQADPSNAGHQTYIWSEGGTLRTVDDDGTNIQAITLGDSENAQVFHRMRANPVFPHKLWYKRDAPNPNPNGTATPEIWVADWTSPGTVYNMAIVGGVGVPADHNCWSPDGTEIGFIYNGKWYVQKVLTSTGAFVNGGSYGNATLIGPTNSESVDYAAWFPDMSQFMVTRGTLAPPNFGGEIFEMSLSGHTTGLALTMSSGSNDNSIPKPVMLDQRHAMFTSDAASPGTPQEYIVTGFPQVSILPAAPQFLMAEVARLMKPLLPASWTHKRAA